MSTIAVEVCAFRLLAPSFGSTQFITTNVLGVVLASLAGGYWVGGRLADRNPRASLLYLLSLAAGLILVILPFIADPVLRAARPAITHQDASLFLGTLGAMVAIFAAPMFLLGMVSPFTIRLLSNGDERAGSRSGLVFALSTLGSIVGAYLPSLVFIVSIGTRGSIQLFGGIIIISAAVGLLASRARTSGAIALILTIFPAISIAWPHREPLAANVLAERETEYHTIRVVRDDRERRNLLEINEGLSYHSIHYDDGRLSSGVWDFLQVIPAAAVAPVAPGAPRPRVDICILGLAAGTVASNYQKIFGDLYDLHIDGVEIDSEIVTFGRRFFGLDERFLKIWIEDARTFLARSASKYDVILGDAYRQPYIPAHLVTKEFFELVRSHLKPDGICVINVGALGTDSMVLRGIQNSMIAAFAPERTEGAVERFDVVNTDVPFTNYVCMASNSPIRPRWARVDRREIAPWRDAAMRSWAVLLKDAGAPVFTDDCAPVEWYTDLSLLKFAMK